MRRAVRFALTYTVNALALTFAVMIFATSIEGFALILKHIEDRLGEDGIAALFIALAIGWAALVWTKAEMRNRYPDDRRDR